MWKFEFWEGRVLYYSLAWSGTFYEAQKGFELETVFLLQPPCLAELHSVDDSRINMLHPYYLVIGVFAAYAFMIKISLNFNYKKSNLSVKTL